jgi:hypothetical protein
VDSITSANGRLGESWLTGTGRPEPDSFPDIGRSIPGKLPSSFL